MTVSLLAGRITRYLNQFAEKHNYPLNIRITFTNWAKAYGITLDDIQASRPDQNGDIEQFNRTYYCTEVLHLSRLNNLT